MVLYKHHLYPRYLDKTNRVPPWGNKDTVVPVTHTQHVMFHWCNYQLWGNLEDKVAYETMRALKDGTPPSRLGNLKFQRLLAEDEDFYKDFCSKMRIISERGRESIKNRLLNDQEFRSRWSEKTRKGAKLANQVIKERSVSDPHYQEKRREWSRRGSLGKVWITDGEVNKKIPRGSPLPDGFLLGRTKHWDETLN